MAGRGRRGYRDVVKAISELFNDLSLIDYCSEPRSRNDDACRSVPALIRVLERLRERFDEVEELVRASKPWSSTFMLRRGSIVAIADAEDCCACIYMMGSEERARKLMHAIRDLTELFGKVDVHDFCSAFESCMDVVDEIEDGNGSYVVLSE